MIKVIYQLKLKFAIIHNLTKPSTLDYIFISKLKQLKKLRYNLNINVLIFIFYEKTFKNVFIVNKYKKTFVFLPDCIVPQSNKIDYYKL